MALEKAIETSYGVTASYHKITVTNIDWHNRVANITIAGFIDNAARNTGKIDILKSNYYWAGDDFVFAPDTNVLAVAYAKLKALEQWSDAIDV